MFNIIKLFRKNKSVETTISFNKIRENSLLYKEFIVTNANNIYNDSFGTWVTALYMEGKYFNVKYDGMDKTYTDITFEDEKEIFFRTFQYLLEEGKIIVVKGNIDPKDPNVNIPIPTLETFTKDPRYKYWNANAKYIVDHIRNTFPKYVKDYNDDGMNAWFYSYNEVGSACPWIGWVDQETGLVEAS